MLDAFTSPAAAADGGNYSAAGGTDCGFNVQTMIGNTIYSEMAHRRYDTLGDKAYCDPSTSP